MEIAWQVAFAKQAGDDRAEVLATPSGHLLIVADGAGGSGGGAEAAEAVVAAARACTLRTPADCARWLRECDQRIAGGGETTAVVVVVSAGQVFGASVGDSEAWLWAGEQLLDLTEHQVRKPLLGSGLARPVAFGPWPCAGRLLLGSDGLFKYVPRERILQLLRALPLPELPAALIDAARLRSGALPDDVAVIVASGEP